jgi:hypothetical protein
VLSQEHLGKMWKLISYFFKTMNLAELNYQIHNKELLVIVKAYSNKELT